MSSDITDESDQRVITVREIVFFPTTVRHPDLGDIRVVDYTRPYEYLDGLYAYVDPETGEYGGMFVADSTEVQVIDE